MAMKDMWPIVHGNLAKLATTPSARGDDENISTLQEQYTALYNQYTHTVCSAGQVLVHQQGVSNLLRHNPRLTL